MIGSAEDQIQAREATLRAWFTRGADALLREIDGLDIGWGGVQRWVTASLPVSTGGRHLDFACGYGTFLAQLGWRYPSLDLVGLNIDFQGPHAAIRPLLAQARVTAELVQADARRMPFPDHAFTSASCFLGLQDIDIGFGDRGVRTSLSEAVRVLHPGGLLVIVDEFPFERLAGWLGDLPLEWVDGGERALDVRWGRQVAQAATELYAQGWVAQRRLPEQDNNARQAVYQQVLREMRVEVERQLAEQGYYVPFGPVRMIVARKVGPVATF